MCAYPPSIYDPLPISYRPTRHASWRVPDIDTRNRQPTFIDRLKDFWGSGPGIWLP